MREPLSYHGEAVAGRFVKIKSLCKGMSQTLYFSKSVFASELFVDDKQVLRGNYKYRFVFTDASVLCGILFESPRHSTAVQPWGLFIGVSQTSSAKFEHNAVFCPQGLHVFNAPDDSTVVVSSLVESPLLVKTNEA